MKKFRFEYEEINRGFIDVYAENEDDALDKAHMSDGDIFINKTYEGIGALIEDED
jgi:hypothetical protein